MCLNHLFIEVSIKIYLEAPTGVKYLFKLKGICNSARQR